MSACEGVGWFAPTMQSSITRLEPPTRWVPHTSECADMPSSLFRRLAKFSGREMKGVNFCSQIPVFCKEGKHRGYAPDQGFANKDYLSGTSSDWKGKPHAPCH